MFDETKKNRIFALGATALVVLIVFLGAEAISVIKGISYVGKGVYPSNVIVVTGKGEIYAVPDIASFSFSVVEEGKTVGEAQDKATKKMSSILPALKALGIEEKDVQTTGYNSYPKYEYGTVACSTNYCPPSKQTLTGYEVSQTITVKVRNTADAGAALTKVGSLGASNISGLDFVIDNMDAVQAQARDKAIADARQKADVLSKSLGIKLHKIVNFYEGGNGGVMYADKAMTVNAMGSTIDSAPAQLPAGQNKIQSQVTITYEAE